VWSATATTLVGVLALLGASVLVGSLLAVREDRRDAARSARVMAAASQRTTSTTAAGPATTLRGAARPATSSVPTTTTTTAAAEATTTESEAEPASPSFVGISGVSVDESTTFFSTGHGCDARLWSAPRRHAVAIAAVAADGRRLVELDASTGEVMSVAATFEPGAEAPEGDGVVAVGAGAVPAVSRDGTRLAYAARRGEPTESCTPDVVVRSLASGEERVFAGARRETEPPASVTELRWSPGGSVAVTLEWEGEWTVLLDPSSDSSLEGRSTIGPKDSEWAASSVDWLGDGRIVLSSWCCYPEHAQRGRLAIVAVDRSVEPLTEPGARAVRVAMDPSGHHLVYVRSAPEEDGPPEVVVRRDVDGEPHVLASGYADLDL
jgi:heme exporter protein D